MDNDTRKSVGPISLSTLLKMKESGILNEDTLVKSEENQKWRKLSGISSKVSDSYLRGSNSEGRSSPNDVEPEPTTNPSSLGNISNPVISETPPIPQPLDFRSPQVREVFRKYEGAPEFSLRCLDCGYEGLMPVSRRSHLPTFLKWPSILLTTFVPPAVVIFLFYDWYWELFGNGFQWVVNGWMPVVFVILLLLRGSIRQTLVICPSCRHEIKTRLDAFDNLWLLVLTLRTFPRLSKSLVNPVGEL